LTSYSLLDLYNLIQSNPSNTSLSGINGITTYLDGGVWFVDGSSVSGTGSGDVVLIGEGGIYVEQVGDTWYIDGTNISGTGEGISISGLNGIQTSYNSGTWWIDAQEINQTITTASSYIISQIPSLDGYATQTWVNSNFIDTSEITTISGDIITYVNNHSANVSLSGIGGIVTTQSGSVWYIDASSVSGTGTGSTTLSGINGASTSLSGGVWYVSVPTLSNYATYSQLTTTSAYIITQILTSASGISFNGVEVAADGATNTSTTPAIPSSANASYNSWVTNLYDNNPSTEWSAMAGTGWVRYDYGFSTPKTINKYRIQSRLSYDDWPKNWTIQGSNDGSNWTTLHTVTNSTHVPIGNYWSEWYTFYNPSSYRYYLWNITAPWNSVTAVAEFQMVEAINPVSYIYTSADTTVHAGLIAVQQFVPTLSGNILARVPTLSGINGITTTLSGNVWYVNGASVSGTGTGNIILSGTGGIITTQSGNIWYIDASSVSGTGTGGSSTLSGVGGISTTLSGGIWYVDGSSVQGVTGQLAPIVTGSNTFSADGTLITHNLNNINHYTSVTPVVSSAEDAAKIGTIYVDLGVDEDTIYCTGQSDADGLPFIWNASVSGYALVSGTEGTSLECAYCQDGNLYVTGSGIFPHGIQVGSGTLYITSDGIRFSDGTQMTTAVSQINISGTVGISTSYSEGIWYIQGPSLSNYVTASTLDTISGNIVSQIHTVSGTEASQISTAPGRIWDGSYNTSTDYATAQMTGNSSPSPYVASASSESTGYWGGQAFTAFDKESTLFWHSQNGLPNWIQIDLGSSNTKVINKYRVLRRSSGDHTPLTWDFQGSDNASDWTTLHSVSNISYTGNWTAWQTFTNSNSYRYYRFYITASTSSYSNIADIQLVEANIVYTSYDILPNADTLDVFLDNIDNEFYEIETTMSGNIVAQIPSLSSYPTYSYLNTVSGNIVQQIPSLTNYVTSSTLITVSGNIVAQIPSLSGYSTQEWVQSNYYDKSAITTISGDIVAYVGSVSLDLTDITTDILPNMTGASGVVSAHSIGSPTQKFSDLYVHDLHVDAGSLYVNDKKVIEDVSDTITIRTDEDQDLAIKTLGLGDINLLSEHSISASSKGGIELIVPSTQAGKDIDLSNSSTGGGVYVTAGGANQSVEILAFDEVNITAETMTVNAAISTPEVISASGIRFPDNSTMYTSPSLTGYATQSDLATLSGNISLQIPSLSDYVSYSYLNTVSGNIISQIPSLTNYVTLTKLTTTSGDIVDQFPSLTGYATESWVNSNFLDSSEISTLSGVLSEQIPSLDGYATETWVNSQLESFSPGSGDNGISSTSSGIAAQSLSDYTVVYADSSNSGYLNLAHYDQTEAKASAFAIVTQSGGLEQDQTGEITLFGKVSNPAWNWPPNTDLWLSSSGTLTTTKPTAVNTYAVPMGHSMMIPQDIWFNPQTGWKIGASSIFVGGPLCRSAVEGRIDINSPTASGTGSSLIWTPVAGYGIGLWNGYEWRLVTPSTIPTFDYTGTVLNGTTTSGGINYDLFAEYVSDDSFNIVAVAWAGDTTRSLALGQWQGTYVYDSTTDVGRKRRFLGTVRRRSTYNLEWVDSKQQRLVLNRYNKIRKPFGYTNIYSTNRSDTNIGTSWLSWDGNGDIWKSEALTSGDEKVSIIASAYLAPAISQSMNLSVGLDAKTPSSAASAPHLFSGNQTQPMGASLAAAYVDNTSAGYHYWYPLVIGTTTNQTIFYYYTATGAFLRATFQGDLKC